MSYFQVQLHVVTPFLMLGLKSCSACTHSPVIHIRMMSRSMNNYFTRCWFPPTDTRLAASIDHVKPSAEVTLPSMVVLRSFHLPGNSMVMRARSFTLVVVKVSAESEDLHRPVFGRSNSLGLFNEDSDPPQVPTVQVCTKNYIHSSEHKLQ